MKDLTEETIARLVDEAYKMLGAEEIYILASRYLDIDSINKIHK